MIECRNKMRSLESWVASAHVALADGVQIHVNGSIGSYLQKKRHTK